MKRIIQIERFLDFIENTNAVIADLNFDQCVSSHHTNLQFGPLGMINGIIDHLGKTMMANL